MNVSKQELIKALAEQLKIIIKKPEWADVVKTGMHKERPPKDSDWFAPIGRNWDRHRDCCYRDQPSSRRSTYTVGGRSKNPVIW